MIDLVVDQIGGGETGSGGAIAPAVPTSPLGVGPTAAGGTGRVLLPDSALGGVWPLCYGYVRARGNELINQELSDKSRIIFSFYGEGEWDGIETHWVNKKRVDHTNSNLYHFHPGVAGSGAVPLTPTSTGGDNAVDLFFGDLPAAYTRTTFSRLVYLAQKLSPDPYAPTPEQDYVTDFRTMKVRAFDNAGTQTGYAFSTNAAWQIIDLIIRRLVKREAAPGEALSSAEAARFDWPSTKDSAEFCDELISGVKRFETSFAFTQRQSLRSCIEEIMQASRLYVFECGGKIYVRADKARTFCFMLSNHHIQMNGFQVSKSNLRGLPNQLVGNFFDLSAQKIAGINSMARSSNVVTCECDTNHPFLVGDEVEVVGYGSGFDGKFVVTEVPGTATLRWAQTGANASGGAVAGSYVGTPESRFMRRSEQVDHEQHQYAVGSRGLGATRTHRRIPLELDFGNNKAERVRRLLRYIAYRNLGADSSPYAPPWEGRVHAFLEAVDEGENLLTYSSDLANGVWTLNELTRTTGIADPFGGTGAIRLTPTIGATNAYFTHAGYSTAPIASELFCGSIWVRAVAGSPTLSLKLYNQTLGQSVDATLNPTSQWQRFSVSGRTLATWTSVRLTVGGGGFWVEADGAIEVYAPQLERGIKVGAYRATTAAIYERVAALVLLPGDVIKVPTDVSEEFATDFEVLDAEYSPQGGEDGAFPAITIGLKQTVAAAHDDTVDAVTAVQPSVPRRGLTPVSTVDTQGNHWADRVSGLSYGLNAIKNPGFEENKLGRKDNYAAELNKPVVDGWELWKNDGGYFAAYVDTQVRTGARALRITLETNKSIPSDNITKYCRVLSDPLPVRRGIKWSFGGWGGWDTSVSLPAGVTVWFRIGVMVFDKNDVAVTEFVLNKTSPFSSYQELKEHMTTDFPSTTAYVRFQCTLMITNNSGSTFNTASDRYADARFDDLFLVEALPVTTLLNPADCTGVLSAQPLTQDGATTNILVASTQIQFGDRLVTYNSGSVNPGVLGTYHIYADDPGYAGGAVTYLATTSALTVNASRGRVYFGTITTQGGGGGTGSGGGTGAPPLIL